MKRLYVLSLFLCFLIFFVLPAPAAAKQFQIGVSPAFLDLGEIGKGESRRGSFIITTRSDEGFMVDIKVRMGSMDFFDGRYGDLLVDYSEQDASSWVKFLNAPIYLDTKPENDDAKDLRADQINFIVNVPENAEPGYHLVEITPKPEVPSGWSTGVNIVAITKINLLFRVSGDAERAGDILDMGAKVVGKRTRFEVLFKNTGSVSMHAVADKIMVFSTEGRLLDNIWSTKTLTEPGEIVKLTGFMTRALEPGSYLAAANVSYTTGHAARESDIWLEAAPEPAVQPPGRVPEEVLPFPWWILIIIILVVGYIIYRYV